MKFKGKVAVWYWAICILAEGAMIYSFFCGQRGKDFSWDFPCVYEPSYAANAVSQLCSYRTEPDSGCFWLFKRFHGNQRNS